MNLTLFRQLYESTFKAEPLLAGFWSVAMYDLEEESFSSWATMREKLEENARNQRKMLKTLFDGLFPATIADTEKIDDFSPEALARLLTAYPGLLTGNEEKLRGLLAELPAGEATHLFCVVHLLSIILLVILGFECLCAVLLFFKYSLSQSIG